MYHSVDLWPRLTLPEGYHADSQFIFVEVPPVNPSDLFLYLVEDRPGLRHDAVGFTPNYESAMLRIQGSGRHHVQPLLGNGARIRLGYFLLIPRFYLLNINERVTALINTVVPSPDVQPFALGHRCGWQPHAVLAYLLHGLRRLTTPEAKGLDQRVRRHPVSVVDDSKLRHPPSSTLIQPNLMLPYQNVDPARPGIDGIVDQFCDRECRMTIPAVAHCLDRHARQEERTFIKRHLCP